MKIKINDKLKHFLSKFKKTKEVKQAKILKFTKPENINKNVVENVENQEVKAEENNIRTIRNGACKEIKKNKVKIQGRRIFIGMIMLCILTASLNIKYSDYLSLDSYSAKEEESITVSSSVSDEDIAKASMAEEVVYETASSSYVVKEETLKFCVPLNGEIQKMYSLNKVIYSKTLGQWKTHDGLDISGSFGQDVEAIEKGVIIDIYEDNFYGITIEIEHINGYKSVYSNLDSEVYVSLGENVVKGQKIGKVGQTSIGEYLDEPHLHFMLYLNDESIDPTYIY